MSKPKPDANPKRPKTPSLVDIFMPEDLCARCNQEEGLKGYTLVVTNGLETAKLYFCSEECKLRFEVALDAVHRFPNGL